MAWPKAMPISHSRIEFSFDSLRKRKRTLKKDVAIREDHAKTEVGAWVGVLGDNEKVEHQDQSVQPASKDNTNAWQKRTHFGTLDAAGRPRAQPSLDRLWSRGLKREMAVSSRLPEAFTDEISRSVVERKPARPAGRSMMEPFLRMRAK
jgi:hypothetical protein